MNSKVIIATSIAGTIGYCGTKLILGYDNTACVAAGVGIALYTGVAMLTSGPKVATAGNDNKLCSKGHEM